MTKRETDHEQLLVDLSADAAAWCLKIVCLSRVGFPDRLILKRGRAWFVELKVRRWGRVASAQRIVHRVLANYGFQVHVLNTDAAVRQFIEEHIRHA